MATILLVDDDRNFLAALDRLLVGEGYETRQAADAPSALGQADQADDGIDLVIADLQLCRESGLDLLFDLGRVKPGLPVILLSASPDARSYLDALRLGAFEFLPKTLDFTELQQVVERALHPVGRTP